MTRLEFITDPLSLLARRRNRALFVLLLTMSLCGCIEDCDGSDELRADTINRFNVTTQGGGTIIRVYNPYNEKSKVFTDTSLEEVFPVNPPPGGYERLARNLVSPETTLIGLAENGSIVQLDTGTGTTARTLATNFDWTTGVASLATDRIYAIASATQSGTAFAPSLSIVNITTFQIESTTPLPTTYAPRSAVVSGDGKYVYIAAPANSAADVTGLLIFDTVTRTIVKTIALEGSTSRPEIQQSGDGGLLFVTTRLGVAVIDTLTQSFSHLLPASTGEHLALDPSGIALYVAPVFDQGGFGVAVYDIATSARTQYIPVAELGTMAMTVTADGRYLVIDQIVRGPDGRNDFPVLKFIELATGNLANTIPWTDSRDTPVTTHRLLAVPER